MYPRQETVEEEQFRSWINKLKLKEGFEIHNLYDELKDGVLFNMIADKIQPGCINWKRVELKVDNDFEIVENHKNFIQVCKEKLGLDYKMKYVDATQLQRCQQKEVLATLRALQNAYNQSDESWLMVNGKFAEMMQI